MNPEITQADKQAAFNRALKHQPLCYPEACDELLAECEMWKRKCGEKDAELADRDKHIGLAYGALGDVNRSVYLFDHIASLRASVGEKPEDAWERGWASGWHSCFNKHPSYHPKPYIAPPTKDKE